MSDEDEGNKFGVSHKIMIVAIASLLGVTILIVLLHFYSKHLLRRQERSRRRAILHHLPLRAIEAAAPIDQVDSSGGGQAKDGLDRSIIDLLPLFMYKSTGQHDDHHGEGMECPVCLNIVVQETMIRVLPNCKHMFHAECIDMWLSLHSTCPICRTMAEPRLLPEQSGLAATTVVVQPTAPPLEESASSSSSLLVIEKVGGSSGSRISSFRRMIGRERSSRRIQNCEDEVGAEDQERQ